MKRLVSFMLLVVSVFSLAYSQNEPMSKNPPLNNLSDTLRAEGNLQIMLSLVEKAGFSNLGLKPNGSSGLTDTSKASEYTFFAPDDAAFAKLAPGVLEKLKQDETKLRQFLSGHAVPKKLMIADMLIPVERTPGKTLLETVNLNGEKVSILCNEHPGEHRPLINGLARIGKADILFANGVVHKIDQLLLNPFQ